MKNVIIVALFSIGAVLYIAFRPFYRRRYVMIREQRICTEVVKTPRRQALGLAGRKLLPQNHGMFFLYKEKTIPGFWMKGMKMAIDIIWIADGYIVGIVPDIMPPPPNTPDDQLFFYSPDEPVSTVLEVGAGTAKQGGWRVGDRVIIESS